MSLNYNAFLFSTATANAECSYCGEDLSKTASLSVEGTEETRYICADCFIRVFDAVTAKKTKKK